MITISDAIRGDEAAIAALCAELDEFCDSLPQGLPAQRAAQVRGVLFGDPPLARALVAWDDQAPVGFAAYSFLWPAAGLTASLYLKELYVAEAYPSRRGRPAADGQPVRRRQALRRGPGRVDHRHVQRRSAGVLRVARREAAHVQDLLPRTPLSGRPAS